MWVLWPSSRVAGDTGNLGFPLGFALVFFFFLGGGFPRCCLGFLGFLTKHRRWKICYFSQLTFAPLLLDPEGSHPAG